MKILKSIRLIINLKTLIITIFALASAYACIEMGWSADFPLTIIGIAVVFPIVFSISGAYKRRETALKYYAVIKAHGRAIFFASRDWVPDNDTKYQEELKNILENLLINCRELFHKEGEERDDEESQIYKGFSKLSLFIKRFRERGLATGEVSRSNQYLSKMIDAFESMKHIYQYRTPITLRAYSKFFIFILPAVYGPYFADLADGSHSWLSYLMPVLFSFILVSLDNIQDHLENPFDQVGEDDIRINAEKFSHKLDLI